MIYSGIEIGMFFELNMGKNAKCSNLFSVIRPLLQMIFVFVQMYFIFLNQKNEYLQKPISIKIWTNAHDCNQPLRLVKRPNIGNES